MSWFRYKSIEDGKPRVVCPVCAHSNVRHPTFQYRGCERCFHDAVTGEWHATQALNAFLLLAGAYLLCALLGTFLALVFIQLPLDIAFGLDLPENLPTRRLVVMVVSLAGAAAGLWIAERSRARRTGPVPPAGSVRKRVDQRIARVVMGAVMAFTLAWTLEAQLEEMGAPDWASVPLLIGLVGLGGLAGNSYDLHRRASGGR